MERALAAAALLLLAGCAAPMLPPPGADATADERRAYCRQSTSVQRAADLDPAGPLGPVPQIARPSRPLASDADYAACLRRYGVTP